MKKLVDDLAVAHKRANRRVAVLQTYAQVTRPMPEEVQAWKEFRPMLSEHADHFHLLVDSSGVAGSILRSSMNCLLLLHGLHGFMSIHASLDETIDAIAKRHGIPRRDVEHHAAAHVYSAVRRSSTRHVPPDISRATRRG